MDTIQLYFNGSERKVIGKSITAIGDPVTCIIKGDSSIMSPVFILNASNGYLSGINYLYWRDTGRYYFIDDVQVLTGGRVALYCTVDVLESFSTSIKNQTAIVAKQQNDNNMYYNDGSFVRDSREFYTIKTFANGFNDQGEYILITAGGSGTIPSN